MPGPKPCELVLTEAERQGLEKLVHRYSTGHQKVLRGRIVLLAAAGQNNTAIAQSLQVSVDTARLWRGRWLALQPMALEDLSVAERLEDLPRPGAPARLTADQIGQIEPMACEKPEQAGRPIRQWTGREIADERVKPRIVDQLSARPAARLLKQGVSNRTGSATG